MILMKHVIANTGLNVLFGPFPRGTVIRSITVTQARSTGTAGDGSYLTMDPRMFGSTEEVPSAVLSWPTQGGVNIAQSHLSMDTIRLNTDCGYARLPINIEVDRFPVLGIQVSQGGAGSGFVTITVEADKPNKI